MKDTREKRHGFQVKEFKGFLAKHPNLSKGVGGLTDMCKGWAGKLGEKLTAFATK